MTNFFSIFLLAFLSLSIRLYAQDVTDTDTKNYGDRLKIGYIWKEKVLFNPLIAETDYDLELNKLLYGIGLFTRTKDGNIVHGISSSSRLLSPQVLRFKLRPNLFFNDGSPVTPEDIKFSFELYKKFSLQSPRLFNTSLISAIETYGEDIVRFKLQVPMPGFSETIGQLPILPKKHFEHLLNYRLISNMPEINPVGFGHYKLSEYIDKKEVKLNADISHVHGRSNLDGIDLLFYDTYDQLLDAFLREEIDLIQVDHKSVTQKISRFTKNIISIDNNYRNLYYINLNIQKRPFNDINIRKSFNYTINKKQIVESLIKNNGNIAYGILTDDTEITPLPFKIYKYYPREGLQILLNYQFKKNKSGKLYRGNKDLKFELLIEEGSPIEESIARIISINLGEIGVDVVPRSLKAADLEKKFKTGNYQAILRQFKVSKKNFGETLREFYLYELNQENSFKNFQNQNLNDIINQMSNSSGIDTSNKFPGFQHIVNQNSPCIFLFFEDKEFFVLNPRFENAKTSFNLSIEKSITIFNPKNEWFVPKDKQKH